MTGKPKKAMVLAAGFGKRMRPLTDTLPKPLVPLLGKPLIDWVFDRLRAGGITEYVVNAHYLGDRIEAHFAGRDDVALSPEAEILDTGGGVKNALSLLRDDSFVVANADSVWLDGERPAVARLLDAWDPDIMDALLLLTPVDTAHGYDGRGDYFLDPVSRARRRTSDETAPLVFAGVHVLAARLLEDSPDGFFSLTLLFDRAEKAGRLFGVMHDGQWYHIGTPEALASAGESIRQTG
ncbi:MAG: nucleotidyltransferase family protein [Alphaproteobacteria bacterium]